MEQESQIIERPDGALELRVPLGDKELIIETGRLAKQANGSALVRCGESMVLATATASPLTRVIDYFPLTVDFEEKMYAAGKIPGGFIKRESRSSEHATLSARLIDRPIRPLFDKKMPFEVQVIALCLSSDMSNPLDVCGMVGASVALCISDIPFDGPAAAVRVGRVNGEFIVNPTFEQMEEGHLTIVVAGTEDAICMVEGNGVEISESDMLEILEFAQGWIKKIVAAQKLLIERAGKPKFEYEKAVPDDEFVARVEEFAKARILDALDGKSKLEREAAIAATGEEAVAALAMQETEDGSVDRTKEVWGILHDLEGRLVREAIVERDFRPDGRSRTEIRPISCEVSLLPRTHGSALFTRGQTQVLSSVTLGTVKDNQRVDGISDDTNKFYIHHYNFPPFSVGEVRPMRGPSRRDIGHGSLAEHAIAHMMPDQEAFPYMVRVVSEVLESNGSSSMASVCGSTLGLMDAGVPIKAPVAGIAMGLIMQPNGAYKILTDIQGIEDHMGDMDFKIAGTPNGINAVQMDIKVKGITREIMAEALEDARNARLFILGKMRDVMEEPRAELSPHAPRIITLQIEVEKIGGVIGPGGKTIRAITEATNTKIDIEDDGRILIYSYDAAEGNRARDMIEGLIADVEVGREYEGSVARIVSFGAFIEILPGKDGLVHISNIANYRISAVEDVLEVGQKVKARVREIDDMGRVNLTMKGLNPGIDKSEEEIAEMNKNRPPSDGDRDRDRGGDYDRRPPRGSGPPRGGGDRRPPRKFDGPRPPRNT